MLHPHMVSKKMLGVHSLQAHNAICTPSSVLGLCPLVEGLFVFKKIEGVHRLRGLQKTGIAV